MLPSDKREVNSAVILWELSLEILGIIILIGTSIAVIF